MSHAPIFKPYAFGPAEKAQLDRDGHWLLPGIITEEACANLVASMKQIEVLVQAGVDNPLPNRNAAEYNSYLESLIGHPQLLALAHSALGDTIRFDHCVTLNRPTGNQGVRWHSHEYAEDDPALGFLRIFFYINGFGLDDANLKVVPGSHLYRDRAITAQTDDDLRTGWLAGKRHPLTGEPLQIEALVAPPATVALMWTHAAHAVNPKQSTATRWCVVYAYRNPGRPSEARWITESYEKKTIPGAEGLLSLY
ncbi:MAG: hypothetical protein KF832_22875 [Caldilineaceae bacterium]|nr:hypothetical protein [Caldilineaceae bacterium]